MGLWNFIVKYKCFTSREKLRSSEVFKEFLMTISLNFLMFLILRYTLFLLKKKKLSFYVIWHDSFVQSNSRRYFSLSNPSEVGGGHCLCIPGRMKNNENLRDISEEWLCFLDYSVMSSVCLTGVLIKCLKWVSKENAHCEACEGAEFNAVKGLKVTM